MHRGRGTDLQLRYPSPGPNYDEKKKGLAWEYESGRVAHLLFLQEHVVVE